MFKNAQCTLIEKHSIPDCLFDSFDALHENALRFFHFDLLNAISPLLVRRGSFDKFTNCLPAINFFPLQCMDTLNSVGSQTVGD